MLSFKLADSFVDSYATRPVSWGYKDAAGNSLGEITFVRTYSRIKEDGTKERWHEVCRRVIEWMFSEQKNHCKSNRLPWNDHKAQRSAQDAFGRMFSFKWTPPGRGLWVAGTPLVYDQRNSAALQNPLHEDTKVFTRDGWQRLGDLEGQSVELLSSTHLYGRDPASKIGGTSTWAKGEVSFIEEQPSVEIDFTDTMGTARTIVASKNHRWFVASGSGRREWTRISGEELKIGDYLPTIKPRINFLPSVSGMQHGFFFGDGSRTNGEFEQFGSSTAVLARLFGDQVKYRNRRAWVGQCPIAWGHLPEGRYLDDQRYVYGFLAGYFAADGCVAKDGSMSMCSARHDELIAVAALFDNMGIEVSPVRLTSTRSNYAEERELYMLRINRFDVTEDFFLKLEHRERWLATTYGRDRHKTRVKVTAIRDAGIQRVLCATVPHFEQFVTEGYVLTSNCAFISTADMTKMDPAGPFAFLMEASMLGVGVGFDDKGADKEFMIYEPKDTVRQFVIPDTREGWVDSLGMLLESYLMPDKHRLEFDYSLIRPAGAPIRTFGGTAAGPDPLKRLHRMISAKFDGRAGSYLSRIDIADIGNLIGVCVVSGNVRRSAELLIGRIDDKDFIQLKNVEAFPERNFWTSDDNDPRDRGWGWMSNNSCEAKVGESYDHLVDAIAHNGEPGLIWMDVTREYGRLIDPPNNKDWRVSGFNPCAEQSLESGEMCTLVETYLNRHDSLEDFQRTLKYAYMYAKTVTLLPTHWERTNAIMQRNRRIGCSVSGIANFADNQGMTELRTWLNEGYATVQKYDEIYSEWLCIRPSIKTTTVKPSGTVSILAGESPGVHWAPGGEFFNRAMRLAKDNALVPLLRDAGYTVETDVADPDNTVVCYFPIHAPAKRAERDVTIFEKANLAVMAQRYWSDNSVSVTLSFDAEHEAKHVGTVLHMHEGQLKTASFLPMGNKIYPQQPYTQIDQDEWTDASMRLFKIDLEPIYAGLNASEAVGESYCSTDSCEIKTVALNAPTTA